MIEASPIFGLLFLNNNLHAPHHERPALAWHFLPGYCRANRAHTLQNKRGYAYRGYNEIFRRFFLRPHEPTPHPFLRRAGGGEEAARAGGLQGWRDQRE